MLSFGPGGRAAPHRFRIVVIESPDRAAPLVGALDAAEVGAWAWIEADATLHWSPQVAEILGLAGDAPLADPVALHERVHPDDRARLARALDESADSFFVRYRFLHRDGSYHWIQNRGRTHRDAGGHLVSQGGAIRDVTEEVRLEQARGETTQALERLLAEQYEQRAFERTVTELSLELVASSSDDLDDAIRSALQRLTTYFGAGGAAIYEIAEDRSTVAVTHWWIDPSAGLRAPEPPPLRVNPFDSQILRLGGERILALRRPADLVPGSAEAEWMQAHGFRAFLLVPLARADDAIGALGLIHRAGMPRDWTDGDVAHLRFAAAVLANALSRRTADEERRAFERRLLDTQKLESLGVLAGGIAHDFNNLLTAILGNASLARDPAPGTSSEVPLARIETAARRAADLCRQMLAYAGRSPVTRAPVDLNALVRDTQSLLDVSVPKKAQLHLELLDALPTVLGDETELRQILMNLVINAAEAIGDQAGTITVRTTTTTLSSEALEETVFSPTLQGGRYVSLEVADTGAGMAPETLPRIFDPFFTTKFTGRGLGLASVVGIVRAHGGALRVDSVVGEGSRFELLLPAHGAPVPTPPPPARPRPDWRGRSHVLVIDDEDGVRLLIRTVLEQAGLTVTEAPDGREGVALFLATPDRFDAVLVDLTMPGLDGFETLSALRACRPAVRALLMSGYSEPGPADAAGCPFLAKPFDPEGLRAAVAALVTDDGAP
ncbi:MAG: ATP-binding protein [Vicinamibacterales bacterium]